MLFSVDNDFLLLSVVTRWVCQRCEQECTRVSVVRRPTFDWADMLLGYAGRNTRSLARWRRWLGKSLVRPPGRVSVGPSCSSRLALWGWNKAEFVLLVKAMEIML